jgi:hypothetical protein
MDHISKLNDDYDHINPWGRKLLRDLAEDYRKLFPNEELPDTSGVVGAPEQLIGQSIESGPAVVTGKPVRRK